MSTELAIRNVDDLMNMAKTLAVSNLLPRGLAGKPADVAIILLYGAELGISPGQSLRGIHVIEGRPELSAQLWNALTRRAGHRVEILEHTDQICRVKVTRGDDGQEHSAEHTMADAMQAGKVQLKDGKPWARSTQGKPLPWETSTKDMLLARALSKCCRFICPEVALGFYAQDEIAEAVDLDPVQVPSERVDAEAAPQEEAPSQEAIQAEIADLVTGFEETAERPVDQPVGVS